MTNIFISYAPEDRTDLEQCIRFLSPLVNNNTISIWSERDIKPGEAYSIVIAYNLIKADVVLVLVSANYLASPEIIEEQFEVALQRQQKGEIKLIPVVLSACLWEDTPMKQFSVLPARDKSIQDYNATASAWNDVVIGIKKAINSKSNPGIKPNPPQTPPPMRTIKIFLASSAELKADRDELRLFIAVENDRLHSKGFYLQLVQWEYFLDAVSDTRLQDEYNKAIEDSDILLSLFYTRAGKYTQEEFETALQLFRANGKPRIYTYFKDAPINTSDINEQILSLLNFKKRLSELGHFPTNYKNIDDLKVQFKRQLDILLDSIIKNTSSNDSMHKDGDNKSSNKSSSATSSTIKDLVSNGKPAKALEALAKLVEDKADSDLSNSVVLLQGRLARLTRDENMGIIEQGDASMERNKITHAILSLVGELDK